MITVPSYHSRRQEHTRTTGFFCGKLYCSLRREDPDPGKWCCLYSPQRGVSAPDVACQLLICCSPSPHYYAPRWAVTRHEFTLTLVHKACLLVRHSGSQHHLIMAIACGTALHNNGLKSFTAIPYRHSTGSFGAGEQGIGPPMSVSLVI